MGAAVSKAATKLVSLVGGTEYRILMVGLDAAGKTTMLYQLKLGEVVTVIPTVGVYAEVVKYKNISFVSLDIGGRDKRHPLWRHYYRDAKAIIFVVDACDKARVDEAREELEKLVTSDDFADSVVLIFANKQDLPDAMTVPELEYKLHVNDLLKGRQWHIQASTAVAGEGLYEGMDWLQQTLSVREAKSSLYEYVGSFFSTSKPSEKTGQ